jgi:MerR family mercuric resistance operon transcriptional regulator
MAFLTTGRLAREAGVNVETIRYYEKRGLLPKVPRKASGYRLWPKDTVKRIRFIRHAQELGFSLREIAELLSLRTDENTSCYEIKRIAEEKITDIDKKIRSLQTIKKALRKLSKTCPGSGPVSDCPILEAMEKD